MWASIFGGVTAASAIGGFLLASSLPLPSFLSHKVAQPLNLIDLWETGFRYQVTRPVNILLMGVDITEPGQENSDQLFSGRSDTMLLVRVNPELGTVNVLSIPRDTQVNIPGEGVAKINHANLVGGPELVVQTIQTNLGAVPIDRYVRISTDALRELVDQLGGVEVMVPQRMVYEDKTQGLTIDLEPGWQTLNGSQAEQFARFRADGNGDIGRVQRQQILLKALRERLTHPTIIPQLPGIMRVMLRYVDTNLTLEETLALANVALELEPDNLHMVLLPGRFSTPDEYVASYWLLDPTGTQQVMNDFFQLDSTTLLANQDSQAVSKLAIAVQNASGEENVAHEVAAYLEQSGFENVYVIGDWSSELQRTQVIAQRGDLESAEVLTSVLGMGRVNSDSTGDLQSELTVRVGRDWTMMTTLVK
jgi:LCP family protein required for cell wall assembly